MQNVTNCPRGAGGKSLYRYSTGKSTGFIPEGDIFSHLLHRMGVKRGDRAMGRCMGQPRRPGRRRQDDTVLRLTGCILVSMGLLLLFLCIPGWAWAVLAGAALVAAGYFLIQAGRR